ncbi:MAG: hypothetical protein DRG33_05195 [Deltaproteobacteria bacterium]|nr:MAG: hypothetical protein DRG33_05195 [Deltaproteobacteria bacterium]
MKFPYRKIVVNPNIKEPCKIEDAYMVYPTNFTDWITLPFSATDMDDVLTYREPSKEPTDPTDYEAWKNYYLTRKAKIKPSGEIYAIISGRWKTDYYVTVKWLERNGIKFRALYLVGNQHEKPSLSKAKKIKELGIKLYLESDYQDALEISKNCPETVVLALETTQFIHQGKVLDKKLVMEV